MHRVLKTIWPIDMVITLCEEDHETFIKEYRCASDGWLPSEYTVGCVTTYTRKNGEQMYEIQIRVEGRERDDIVDTAYHESIHVWQELVRYLRDNNPGDETQAYFICWLAESIREFVDERYSF